jgi:hypothetical protein
MAGDGGFHAPGGGIHAPIVAAGAVSCCCGRLGGDHAPIGVLPSRGAGPVRSSTYHDKNRRCIGTSQLTRQNKQIQLTTHPDRRARSRIRSRRASSPCAARPSPAARRSTGRPSCARGAPHVPRRFPVHACRPPAQTPAPRLSPTQTRPHARTPTRPHAHARGCSDVSWRGERTATRLRACKGGAPGIGDEETVCNYSVEVAMAHPPARELA